MKSLYNLLLRNGTAGAFILGTLFIIISLLVINMGLANSNYDLGTDLNAVLKAGTENTFDFFNIPLSLPIAMVVICLVAAVFFGLMQLISNPKGSLKVIVGLAVVLVLFLIFYSMATPETAGKLGELHGKFGIGETASKVISGGIKTTLALTAAATVLAIISLIRSLFQ